VYLNGTAVRVNGVEKKFFAFWAGRRDICRNLLQKKDLWIHKIARLPARLAAGYAGKPGTRKRTTRPPNIIHDFALPPPKIEVQA